MTPWGLTSGNIKTAMSEGECELREVVGDLFKWAAEENRVNFPDEMGVPRHYDKEAGGDVGVLDQALNQSPREFSRDSPPLFPLSIAIAIERGPFPPPSPSP